MKREVKEVTKKELKNYKPLILPANMPVSPEMRAYAKKTYLVSADGDVLQKRSDGSFFVPKLNERRGNHFVLRLCYQEEKCFIYIHRAIFFSFNPAAARDPKKAGMAVDHVDNNSRNNNLANLQLISAGDNTRKYFAWRREQKEQEAQKGLNNVIDLKSFRKQNNSRQAA